MAWNDANARILAVADLRRPIGLSLSPSLVAGRRERVLFVDRVEFALLVLPDELGPRLLVLLALADVGLRWRVRGRRHLVRVVVVNARRDALLLGEAGQLVFVEAVYLAAVLPAVPVEPFGELLDELAWLVWILLRHRASLLGLPRS